MNKFLHIILFLSLIFTYSFSSSQDFKVRQKTIDSFENLYRDAKANDDIKAIIKLSKDVLNDSVGLSKFYAEQSLKLAKRAGDEVIIGKSYLALADAVFEEGEIEKSREYYLEAFKILEKSDEFNLIADSRSGLGMTYYIYGEYEKAIEEFKKALEFDRKSGVESSISERLNNLGVTHKRLGEYDKALEYYNEALEIDKYSGNDTNLAIDYNNIGAINKARGLYEDAIDYYKKALEIDLKLNLNQGLDAAVDYNNLGQVYYSLGKYDQALEYFQKALKIAEKAGNLASISSYLSNVASVYDTWKDYDNAIKHYKQALEIDRKLGRQASIGSDLNNIGFVYFAWENYEEAVNYFEQALEIFRQMKQESAVAVILNNVGEVYREWGQLDKAIAAFEEALEIDERLEREANVAEDLNIIGRLYYSTGDYQKSIRYLEQSVEIAERLKLLLTMQHNYQNFSDVYNALGQYQKALDYYKKFTAIKDSIFTKESQEKLQEFQTKYQVEKTENEIKLQKAENAKLDAENKRQRLINLFIIIGLAFLAGMVVIVFRSLQRKKRDNKIIEQEKEKSEKLLLNTLPQKVVQELKETGKAEPEGFENVTLFFSDFVGFTRMSSALEPKKLIGELNTMFTAFDDIMSKYNCERIKTIGDAYMAVAGMPEINENHAENMLKAAVDIIKYLEVRNKDHELKWRLRIGLNSGRVVGGIVGVRKYLYDVFGDTVNTASRMESNSEPMRINVSEATYDILKDKYSFIKRDPIEVKGKGMMSMYFLDYTSE